MEVKIAGVSLLHAAVVISGILAMISGVNAATNGTLPTGMEAVHLLCSTPPEYKDLCIKTLTPTARKNASATVKDFALVAFEAVLNELKITLNKTDSLRKTLNLSKYNLDVMQGCDDEAFRPPISWVEEAISNITNSNDPTLSGLRNDLIHTAINITSDQMNCAGNVMYPDGFNPDVFRVLNAANDYLDDLSSIAINIVTQIGEISSDSNKGGNV